MARAFSITGVNAMVARLQGIAATAHRAAAAALYQEGEAIIAEAKERVPVDLGTLKNSGFVELPRTEGNTIRVTVGFGGPAAPYAVVVHEDLEAHHDVGGPKYLESVITERAAGFPDRLAAAIARELR